jgi:vacuolar iron transporter family protein
MGGKMLSRNLDKARSAYKGKDIEEMRKAHDETNSEPHKLEKGRYIKSLIYGGLDGTITTFAVVAGVAGASLSAGIVLILGFANLIADGLSMAIGDYLSTKAENEYNKAEYAREKWEVENYPEGEKKELVEVYMDKGISEEDANTIVNIITKDKKVWLDTMMVEELGIIQDEESPLKNSFVTFFSFAVFGFVPLAIHLLTFFVPSFPLDPFVVAGILTGLTLFTLGALKSKITERHWFASGAEMLFVGGIAAVAAYYVGLVLEGLA